jgi:hypothetical protein
VGNIENAEDAFVISQNPPYDGVSTMGDGGKIHVTISSDKPADCP